MKLCPDDICQMVPNKKTKSSQKGGANKFDEIERKQVTGLEQNEQKDQPRRTGKYMKLKGNKPRVDLERNE